MASINIPDISLPSEQPKSPAPSASGITIPDISIPTDIKLPEKEEGSWADVIGSAFANMPARFDRAWQGITQGISVAASQTASGVTANNALSVIDASKAGVESATAKLASLGFKASDFDVAPDASYDQKRERNERFRGLVDKLQVEQLNQDPDFVAARDEGLRLSGEIAANTPETRDWSAKDLVSQIIGGGVDMAPAILAGVLTKSSSVALAGMTPQAYGMYYQDGVDKGLTPMQAQNRAAAFAALEPLTEALPVGLIMRKGAGRLTDLGASALAEGAQEGVTQMLQDAYDVGLLDEKMTLGQFLSNAAKSTIVGAGVGGAIHGTLHAGDMVAGRQPEGTAAPTVADEVAAAGPQESSSVPTGEYDAAAAEMSGYAPDANGIVLPEPPRAAVSAEDYAQYKAARDAGSSPQDALDLMQRNVQDNSATTVGGDALDSLVNNSLQPRDASSALRYGMEGIQIPAYLREQSPEVGSAIENAGATPVAEMVREQAQRGDQGLSPLELPQNLLPAPGQTSTIALPGTPGAAIVDQPTRPKFSMRDRGDERASSTNTPGRAITIPDIVLPETSPALPGVSLPETAGARSGTAALETAPPQAQVPNVSLPIPETPAQSAMRPRADQDIPAVQPPVSIPDIVLPEAAPETSGVRLPKERNQETWNAGDQFVTDKKVATLEPGVQYTVQGRYGDSLTLEGNDRVPRVVTESQLRRAGVTKGLPVQEESVASESTPSPETSTTSTQPSRTGAPQEVASPPAMAKRGWRLFEKDSGTLNVPRSEMPQISSEHRGALANFLNARGAKMGEREMVSPDTLKATQAEYSPSKVKKAKSHTGTERAILISNDNHVVDGHHQWLAAKDQGKDIPVIKLDAPIADLLPMIKEFPSVTSSDASGKTKIAPSVAEAKPKQQGMKAQDVAKEYGAWSKGMKGLENVRVSIVPRQADIKGLPDGAPAMMAFYDPGHVQMVAIAENISTPEEAHAQFRHELIAHYGLRARLSKPEYDKQMDRVLAAEGKDKRLDAYFKDVRESYNDVYDLSSPDGQRMIAEEVVAKVAENADAAQRIGVIRQVIEALRKMMVKAGLINDRATFNDVVGLVKANTEFLRQNRVDNDDVRRSIAPMQFQAPDSYAPSLRKDRRVEDAAVPDDIKDGMRKVLHTEDGSITDTINGILDSNTRKAARNNAYQAIFDDLNPIAELEKAANSGELKSGAESAYKLAANSRQINSIVAAAMTEGVPVWQNGGIMTKPGSKGLLDIFNPIAKMKGNQLALWEYWAGAVRGKRLIAEGRENLYTQEEIDRVINYVNSKPELRKSFNTAHKEYQEYKKQLLDFAEQSGVVDPEARKLWDKDDYVPLYRVADESDKATAPGGKSRSFVNQSSGIKTLKGGTGKVDIINNILQNASHLISSSYNNRVGQMITEIADGIAMQEVPAQFKPVDIKNSDMKNALNELGVSTQGLTKDLAAEYSKMFMMAPPAGKDIVSVMFEGKRKYYQVTDPGLMRAINTVGPRTVNRVMQLLFVAPKTILTRAVTSTPDFVIRNITRDILGNYVQQTSAAGRTGVGHILADSLTLRPIRTALKGAYKTLRSDEQVKAYKAAGGFSGGYDNARPDALAKQLRSLQKGVTAASIPRRAWEKYEHYLEAGEMGTRMSVFDDVYKRTGDITEATYQANDVLNFSRRGDSQILNFFLNTVPFMNARVQGLDRLARGAKDNWKGFMLKGALISAATMALMAMNKDDERYWAINESVRDNYWVIPVDNGFVQIPKPFEVGSLFGTVIERAYEAASRDDKVFWDRMGSMFLNTFAMNPIPQSVSPIAQDFMNKDFFTDRPIVSEGSKFKEAQDQFDSYTADIIKDLSKSLPDWFPNSLRSPVRLQHLMEAYTGSMGQYVISASDELYRQGLGLPDRPERASNDIAGLNVFLKPDNKSSKYITRVYEMQQEVREANAKLKDYREAHDAEGVRKTRKDKEDELAARKSVERASKKLTDLSKKSRDIMKDPDLSAAEKRVRMDEITRQKNVVAKEINDRWWRKIKE